MVRFSVTVFIFSLLLTPGFGHAAMKSLSNNSLRQVEIIDAKNATESDLPSESPSTSVSAGSTQHADRRSSINSKYQLNRFRNSSDYRNFLAFIQELHRISQKKMYLRLIDSERFLSFCSNFATVSTRCKQRLSSLNLQYENSCQKTIFKNHQELFRQVALFHKSVYQYQKQNSNVPDLEQFLTRIKVGLNTIDAEYAEL